MKVEFNTVSFKASEFPVQPIEKSNVPVNADSAEHKDKFEKSDINSVTEPKKKTTAKEKLANVWKFFSVTNQMANSTLKGLLYGAVTGIAFLGGAWVFRALPKAFTKGGPSLWNVVKHPLNNMGKAGKVIAGVAGTLVFSYHLVAGKLEANQKTAVIDHKLKVGHRD